MIEIKRLLIPTLGELETFVYLLSKAALPLEFVELAVPWHTVTLRKEDMDMDTFDTAFPFPAHLG